MVFSYGNIYLKVKESQESVFARKSTEETSEDFS